MPYYFGASYGSNGDEKVNRRIDSLRSIAYGEGVFNDENEERKALIPPGLRSVVARVGDIFMRSNYAVVGAFDAALDTGRPGENAGERVWRELFGKGDKEAFAELLKQQGVPAGPKLSELVRDNPTVARVATLGGRFDPDARGAVGLALDILNPLDPFAFMSKTSKGFAIITRGGRVKHLTPAAEALLNRIGSQKMLGRARADGLLKATARESERMAAELAETGAFTVGGRRVTATELEGGILRAEERALAEGLGTSDQAILQYGRAGALQDLFKLRAASTMEELVANSGRELTEDSWLRLWDFSSVLGPQAPRGLKVLNVTAATEPVRASYRAFVELLERRAPGTAEKWEAVADSVDRIFQRMNRSARALPLLRALDANHFAQWHAADGLAKWTVEHEILGAGTKLSRELAAAWQRAADFEASDGAVQSFLALAEKEGVDGAALLERTGRWFRVAANEDVLSGALDPRRRLKKYFPLLWKRPPKDEVLAASFVPPTKFSGADLHGWAKHRRFRNREEAERWLDANPGAGELADPLETLFLRVRDHYRTTADAAFKVELVRAFGSTANERVAKYLALRYSSPGVVAMAERGLGRELTESELERATGVIQRSAYYAPPAVRKEAVQREVGVGMTLSPEQLAERKPTLTPRPEQVRAMKAERVTAALENYTIKDLSYRKSAVRVPATSTREGLRAKQVGAALAGEEAPPAGLRELARRDVRELSGMEPQLRAAVLYEVFGSVRNVQHFERLWATYGDLARSTPDAALSRAREFVAEGRNRLGPTGQRWVRYNFGKGANRSLDQELPEGVAKYLENFQGKWQENPEVRGLLRVTDFLTNSFKFWATVGPASVIPFSVRNIISGISLAFQDLGLYALNPQHMSEFGSVVFGRDGTLRTATGRSYPFDAVRAQMRGLGVLPDRKSLAEFVGQETPTGRALGAFYKIPAAGENLTRGLHYVALLKQGFTPGDAAARMKRFQIDYADLSPTERNVFRRLVPFYTWASRNLRTQVRLLTEKPGVVRAQLLPAGQRGPSEDYLPEYLRGELAVTLEPDESGNPRYLTGIDLPVTDLNQLYAGSVGRTLRQALGQVHPLVKMPMELAFGQDSFTGKSIRGSQMIRSLGPGIEKWPEPLKEYLQFQKGEVNGETTYRVNGAKLYLLTKAWVISRFITTQGTFERFLSEEGRTSGRLGAWTAILSGMQLQDFDLSEAQQRRLYENARRLEDVLLDRGVLAEFQTTYQPGAKARSGPSLMPTRR